VNRKQAATALGITDRQLGNWSKEDWFPAAGRSGDQWHVSAIRRARDEQGRKGSPQNSRREEIRDKREQAKLAKELAEARLKGLAVKSREGELMPRSALELFGSTLLTELGDVLEQLPDLAGKQVSEEFRETIRAYLRKELNNARDGIRRKLENAARELDELTSS